MTDRTADESATPQRHLSLIPYPFESGEVVLRRGEAVVLYDAQSRQLSVRDASEQSLELTECPYCHRPMRDEYIPHPQSREDERLDEHDGRATSPRHYSRDAPFVDPDYFGMLAASRRNSPDQPSTPNRPLFQPALRSGRSRDVSGTHHQQEPPAEAEFVGSEPNAPAGHGISSSAFSQGYFKQFFKEIGELGRGGNGVVLLVEHVLDRVVLGQFACKRIPVGNDHDWLEKVLVEVKLLQKVPHRNLVAYHWVWLEDYQPTKFGPSVPCLWILQEFCSGGDLHNYVLGPNRRPATAEDLREKRRRRSKGDPEPPQDLRGPSKLTFDEIFSFFRDITSGLHHLHNKGYIHRDLKPSNCLLQRDGHRTRVLISDFGEVQAAGANRGSTGATGTISYCAPEVLRRDPQDGVLGNFTTKSDIFSLGMIVYFMCFGRLPYGSADDFNEENEDLEELRAEITSWPGFNETARARPDLPERLYKYLRRLLSVDPNERPSTDAILASIKGGAGLSDVGIGDESGGPRVSSLDSPRYRASPQGRKPVGSLSGNSNNRPGLGAVGRPKSSDAATQSQGPVHRQESPYRDGSRPQTPTADGNRSIVKRPRKFEIAPTSTQREDDPTRQQTPELSPPLMLPAPPPPLRWRTWQTVLATSQHHYILTSLRLAFFLAKLLTLTVPCSPYATSPWVQCPLLVLAALDLGIVNLSTTQSTVLMAIHVTCVVTVQRTGKLCEGADWTWGDGWG